MFRMFDLAAGALAALVLAGAGAAQSIPVEAWADTDEINALSMSQDGGHIAMLQRTERGGFHRLVVFSTSDPEGTMAIVPFDDEARPFNVFWKGNERVVLSSVVEREIAGDPVTVVRHLAFDPYDTRDVVNLLDSGSSGPRSEMADAMSMLSRGFIATALMDDPDHVIMGLITSANNIADYYKVNVHTGSRERVLRGNDRYSGFGFDWDGEARSATTYEPDGPRIVTVVREKGETSWIPIGALDATDRNSFSLLGFFDPARPNVAVISANTPGQDTQGLFEIDIRNPDERTLIVQEAGFEPTGAIRSPRIADRGRIIGFSYANGTRAYDYVFDPEYEELYGTLEATFPDRNVSVVRMSDDRSTTLIYTSGPLDPGTYYLFRDGVLAPLMQREPGIPSEALSPVEEIIFTARDGRSIPALVTRPANVDLPAPGIALPHGGPWARDTYGYDEWAQMLAHQGYVVVQPNFRGSDGIGKDHWLAGDNEWGQAMQDDVEDAMLAVVERGWVDRDRMGIFGWSFGGFTAVAAAARDNDVFNCSAAGAAVTDIGRIRGGLTGSRFLRQFQQPTITGFNPLANVSNVTIPMLVIHGDADDTVPVLHSRLWVDGLQRAGVDYEYVEIANMRHSPFYYDQNMQWFPELLEFFETKCQF